MSSDTSDSPKTRRQIARETAERWYRRLEDRVAITTEFGKLVAGSTLRWGASQRIRFSAQNPWRPPLRPTLHSALRGCLMAPYDQLKRFIRAREVEALSELWELGWGQPDYSKRKTFHLIRGDGSRVAVSSSAGTGAVTSTTVIDTSAPASPIPVPTKIPPTE